MRRFLALAGVLVLAVAGCGGGGKSNKKASYSGPAAGPSPQAAQQDAAAKANARNLVSEVEVCFVDQQMYTACKKPPGTKLAIGSGPGQVEVSAAGDATYTIVAHSKSGTSFEIVKDASGAVKRTCDKPGQGGCQAGGTW